MNTPISIAPISDDVDLLVDIKFVNGNLTNRRAIHEIGNIAAPANCMQNRRKVAKHSQLLLWFVRSPGWTGESGDMYYLLLAEDTGGASHVREGGGGFVFNLLTPERPQ